MPKAKKTKESIFTWVFESSRGIAGGAVTNYVSQLNSDGSTSCNCPGWIFNKPGKDGLKSCKHTNMVKDESKELYKTWKTGGSLPRMISRRGSTQSSENLEATSTEVATFGRVIEV